LVNAVRDQSGAIFVGSGDPMFISCTIAGNTSANDNAIYNSRPSNQVVLVNTLLWNPGTSTEIGGYTSAIVFDYSLTRDDLTGNVLIDNVNQLTMNPELAFDYLLLAASVARDAGTLSRYAATDLDGETLADGLKDIGARTNSPTVTTTGFLTGSRVFRARTSLLDLTTTVIT